jgi:hypothetical protein
VVRPVALQAGQASHVAERIGDTRRRSQFPEQRQAVHVSLSLTIVGRTPQPPHSNPTGIRRGTPAYCTRVLVSPATVWRRTEQAGAAYVVLQTAQVEELERTLPPPARGAVAQLVQGEGEAVKTVALGHVQESVLNTRGEQAVQTTALSSFSRLAD